MKLSSNRILRTYIIQEASQQQMQMREA